MKTLDEMQWLPVVDFEDLFEISEYGHMRRLVSRRSKKAGTLVGGTTDRNGYTRYYINDRDGCRLSYGAHFLVAQAFIGRQPVGYEVHHKDHNPANNHYSNLEWVTHKQNIQESYATRERRLRIPKGLRAGMAKLAPDMVDEIRMLYATGNYTQRTLGAMFGVSYVSIGNILRGKTHAESTAIIPEAHGRITEAFKLKVKRLYESGRYNVPQLATLLHEKVFVIKGILDCSLDQRPTRLMIVKMKRYASEGYSHHYFTKWGMSTDVIQELLMLPDEAIL